MIVTLFEQAQALLNEGMANEAAAMAKHGLEIDPDQGPLWQLLGVAFWRLDDPQEAQDALETGSSFALLHPLAQHVLAQCYARQGLRDLARLMWRHLLDRGHALGGLLPDVAAVLHRQQEYDLALDACRLITESEPDNHRGFFGIAYYQSRLGAPAAALVEPLARAMDLAPHLAAYRLNLACVLTKLGRAEEAYDLLRRLPLETVRCHCWLTRLKRFFLEIGDVQRARACEQQLRKSKS